MRGWDKPAPISWALELGLTILPSYPSLPRHYIPPPSPDTARCTHLSSVSGFFVPTSKANRFKRPF